MSGVQVDFSDLLTTIQELEERVISEKTSVPSEFSYDPIIKAFWDRIVKEEREAKNIRFDMENDDPIGKPKKVTLDMNYPNGDPVAFLAQLYSAGGDWQNSVGYFRCQDRHRYFIVIPGPEVNKNLRKDEEGYSVSDNNEEDGEMVTDMEKELWEAMKQEVAERFTKHVNADDHDTEPERVFYN